MVKIPEALARCDYVKASVRKVCFFCRGCLKGYLHACGVCQVSCLFYLLWRYIRACPVRSIPVHIPRQHAGACSEIQNILSFNAEASLHDLLIEFFRIDVSVFCIIFRCPAPVKCFPGIYPAVSYFHASNLLQFQRETHFISRSGAV